ncbi:PEGA domain-containing protein [Candidatus Saccharibacteria bacterium]|nr:PEGA domain-containing protein [Candidatus Saccharibacteria bacterium]
MESKRFESAKIIISESIMVITVVLTVIILAFVVSGYWLNADFKVERQGMLQISSTPTGAYIHIDDDDSNEDPSWLSATTNTSKILSSGEHKISLSKEGYDTWSKTVNISEGLLYRLDYPRLFLKERASEAIMDLGSATKVIVSPSRERAVLANNTSKWSLVELNDSKLKQTEVDISKIFSGISKAAEAEKGLFTDEIISADWSGDNNHLLIKTQSANSTEWVLLNVDNLEKSINISKEFGASFEDIEILDQPSNTLMAVREHNLHKIDLSNKSISSILVGDIISFDHLGDKVFFSARNIDASEEKPFYIGSINAGDDEIEVLRRLDSPVRIVASRFYDETYLATQYDNIVSIYRWDKKSLSGLIEQELSFVPDSIKAGHHGEFIVFSKDNKVATLDMESTTIAEWEVDGASFGWIDNSMIYSVSDSRLIVYDYDGLNRRELSSNVSSHFPVVICDDKWLYFVSDDTLVREWLIEH